MQFPAYLSSHPNLPQKDLSRYQEQQEIVGKILSIFKKKDYDDENDEMRGEVVGLMTRVSDSIYLERSLLGIDHQS